MSVYVLGILYRTIPSPCVLVVYIRGKGGPQSPSRATRIDLLPQIA